LVVVGEFGGQDLGLAAMLLPPVLIGFVTSRWTTRFLDQGRTRHLVLGFAVLAAATVAVRNL
jgi:uncharacterized membrane protein YfcA